MIRRALFAVLLVFAVGLPAFAHRVGVPTTLIEQNPVSGVWEITHRVSAHDFDEVFAGLINPVQLYSSSQGQKLIETYVGERFKVEGELVAPLGKTATVRAGETYLIETVLRTTQKPSSP